MASTAAAAPSAGRNGAAAAKASSKFDELDEEGKGYLAGAALGRLADWVWAAYHGANGRRCSEEEKVPARLPPSSVGLRRTTSLTTPSAHAQAGLVSRLMAAIDEDMDGRLSRSEFEDFFCADGSGRLALPPALFARSPPPAISPRSPPRAPRGSSAVFSSLSLE